MRRGVSRGAPHDRSLAVICGIASTAVNRIQMAIFNKNVQYVPNFVLPSLANSASYIVHCQGICALPHYSPDFMFQVHGISLVDGPPECAKPGFDPTVFRLGHDGCPQRA
jgi:hypothetical protein